LLWELLPVLRWEVGGPDRSAGPAGDTEGVAGGKKGAGRDGPKAASAHGI